MLLVKNFRSQIALQNYTYFLYSQNFRQLFLKINAKGTESSYLWRV